MSYSPSFSHLTEAQASRSEEHIDDVDAQMPRQDVLIPPWASPSTQTTSPQAALRSQALLYSPHANSFVIQPVRNNFNNNTGQNGFPQLSAISRPHPPTSSPFYQDVQPHRYPLESSLPSSSTNLDQHGSINSSTRLRTSPPVFGTTTKLAAHYGIPTKLPPTPRVNSINNNNYKPPVPHFNGSIAPPTEPIPSTSNPDAVNFFQNLISGYMNMLSNKPDENDAANAVPQSPAAAPYALEPSAEDAAQSITSVVFGKHICALAAANGLADTGVESIGNEFASPWNDFSEFLTSPLMDDESPYEGLLETPVHGMGMDDFFTSPVVADSNSTDAAFQDLPLFSQSISYSESAIDVSKMTLSSARPNSSMLSTPALDGLLTMSPSSPALDPLSTQTSPAVVDSSSYAPRSKSKAPTGTRKNITPEALVPLDAPTQPRTYVMPSTTSRKEIPAVFARKRARSTAFGDDEEDELAEGDVDAPPPTMTEAQAIAAKRRQNTLAARRSRMRKLEYQRQLEEQIAGERKEKDMWKERALMLRSQVMQLGFPEPFRDEA
ncbi:hypothetical protein M0805_001906 [Coniferiporia weirii]|nr:hypothetical protein M0805_001906 [Coniferiporia weirii]